MQAFELKNDCVNYRIAPGFLYALPFCVALGTYICLPAKALAKALASLAKALAKGLAKGLARA